MEDVLEKKELDVREIVVDEDDKLQIKKEHYMKLIRKKVIMKKCLN